MVSFLKYLAIFLTAASGALGLLVDFKKDGRVTKYGWVSLIGIVLSFLVSAILQGVEIHNNSEADLAEKRKTQNILHEISRGTYSIDVNDITFDFEAQVSRTSKVFEAYNKRIQNAIQVYKDTTKILPPGTYRFNRISENGEESLIALVISPESPLFPNGKEEKKVYDLIGEIGLDVEIYKKNKLDSFLVLDYQNANLWFNTERVKPQLKYSIEDTIIEISAANLKPDSHDYSWRNHGGIESLLDLDSGTVSFTIRENQNLDKAGQAVERSIEVRGFSFNVKSRRFSSFQLCTIPAPYHQYYVKLPSDVLKTHLNLRCN
jgi:hypothetical protein